ncbi:RecQ family zinc-binding domain-containing protein [Streptomyces qaidamensis]|uniref:RecQ family zinc-binding domain-containing protein n=1 Tax=Streptomyces qaidamensis TaxID=1783515 RepID=UPI0036F0265D
MTVEGRRRAVRALPGRTAKEAAEEAARVFKRRRRVDRSRIEMMRGYAETATCRRQYLLGYFGEQLDAPCGQCDVCDREDEHPATGPGTGTPLPRPGTGPMRRTTGCATRTGVRAP